MRCSTAAIAGEEENLVLLREVGMHCAKGSGIGGRNKGQERGSRKYLVQIILKNTKYFSPCGKGEEDKKETNQKRI